MQSGAYDLNKDFIEEVRNAASILDVVGRHVQLRKQGSRHVGLCPFHDEKTASFGVNPERQLFYCFGCHTGGDVFKFLMLYENMSFPEAVVELAKEAGLTIPRKSRERREQEGQRAALVEANEAALQWFRKNLQAESAHNVREYLQERGFDTDAIDTFEIGWAPDSYDALQKALENAQKRDTLLKAGLIQESSGRSGVIDRFRKRIIIPIRAAGGRLVAFGGRVFGEGEPKYLNSPETPVFNKSRVLYGLDAGMRTIRRTGFAILVEGYFDVIALHLAGFNMAVAPLGTSLTEEHARLLRRYCGKAAICMDADSAGQRAAVRSAATLLNQGFAVNVVPLPKGADPDSFIQKEGTDGFKKLLQRSEPAYRFMLRSMSEKHDMTRPAGKRQALEEMTELLCRIRDQIERSEAIRATAMALDVEPHVVTAELRRRTGRQIGKAEERKTAPVRLLPADEKELLRAATFSAEETKKAVEEFRIFEYVSPFAKRLLSTMFESGASNRLHSLTELAESQEEEQLIAEIAMGGSDDHHIDPRECAISISIRNLNRRIARISSEIAELEKRSPADVRVDELISKKFELSRRIHDLQSRKVHGDSSL